MRLLPRAGVPVDREGALGTVFGGRPDRVHRIAGFGVHLAISGGFGVLYDAAFERLGRADWRRGALLSPAHSVVSGIFYAALDRVHPLVPAVLPDPGLFFRRARPKGPILLLLVKGAFGAAVGELDRALRRRR